jgi:hypothetical protein
MRRQQRLVLGEHGERDLVEHGTELEEAFHALRDYVVGLAERTDVRLETIDNALSGAVSHRALVRYDAYNEMSGRQSISLALLDRTHSGLVVTSIHHRDQARLYAKQLYAGQSDLELSPEEAEAVRLAVAARPSVRAPATGT